MYQLPRHISIPNLSDDATEMLDVFAVTCQASHGGYLASWHISEALPWARDLDVGDGPGRAAMKELCHAGLVEPVPELGCRYRLTERGALLAIVRQLVTKAQP